MVFFGYHSLMSEVLSRHPPAAFEGASSDIYSLKFLLQLRYLERQLATHCNIHKRDLHHIVVHGLLSGCFVVIWPKCCDCFKKPDSSECKQMWIHKRKLHFHVQYSPSKSQLRTSTEHHHGAELLSGCDQLTGKKIHIPKWLAPENLWTVVLWLKCRKGGYGEQRRNYLFSASKMCQCHDIERGDLPLKNKDMVRLGWGICLRNAVPQREKPLPQASV